MYSIFDYLIATVAEFKKRDGTAADVNSQSKPHSNIRAQEQKENKKKKAGSGFQDSLN